MDFNIKEQHRKSQYKYRHSEKGKLASKKYYQDNKEKIKKYRQEHKEERKEYYLLHKNELLKKARDKYKLMKEILASV